MFTPSKNRYDKMQYNRCGQSGLLMPAVSLGLWHNFGHADDLKKATEILEFAFDNGITHFDLANNYGPPPGAAEENFGRVLNSEFKDHRHEMLISTKAGYYMWDGPYGEWGSRKYLFSSLDQSLKRMGLEYVDIFYSHRFDPDTPLEETMLALHDIVKQGKALYVGVSNYSAQNTARAWKILSELKTPFIIHQPRYSMFDRWVEDGLLDVLEEKGLGCICYSPLAQGLLTSRYLKEIPTDSRAVKSGVFLSRKDITPQVRQKIAKLNELAITRGQSLAQMALSWVLKDKRITSVLVGVSSKQQLADNLKATENCQFSKEELEKIEKVLRM